jgi:hypothetical protein
MSSDQQQQWRKRLRAHDRKMLATIVGVLATYFAALLAVIYWALASVRH